MVFLPLVGFLDIILFSFLWLVVQMLYGFPTFGWFCRYYMVFLHLVGFPDIILFSYLWLVVQILYGFLSLGWLFRYYMFFLSLLGFLGIVFLLRCVIINFWIYIV
jgi:hypothetical protein